MAPGALCLSPSLYCRAAGHALLAESIFVTTFRHARNYFELTVESTARAITAKTQGRPYRVTIFVDGLTRPEQATFTHRLRARGIARKKVRGVRDEQSNAGVRLADALCGLIRDADEGEPWALAILAQLHHRQVVTLL